MKIENLLMKSSNGPVNRKNWRDFAGIISGEEANEWLKNIEDCEQINPDNWK